MPESEEMLSANAATVPESWGAVLSWSLKAFAVTVVAWAAIRAFTGIFEIRNLRFVVGACALAPVALGQIYILGKRSSLPMVPVVSLVGMASIVLAEGLAALVTGEFYPPWDDFSMGFLAVLGGLPVFAWWKLREK